jgi:hypothetical protein
MDLISSLLSALLFVAFVPGVLVTLPPKSSRGTVILTHAVLFAIVVSLVMQYYWHNIRHVFEKMTNYGDTCPNGYVEGLNQAGQKDCVPVGHATASATTGFKSA